MARKLPNWLVSLSPKHSCSCPGQAEIGRFYCTLFRNREEKVNPGGYLTADSRGNLRRMHDEFQKKHNTARSCASAPSRK